MKNVKEAWRRVRAALRAERGFTLTELAVVIAIIGIMAAAAVPTYTGVRQNAYKAEAKNVISEIRSLVYSYRLENNAWPASLATVGFDGPTSNGTGCSSPSRFFYGISGTTNLTITATSCDWWDGGTGIDRTVSLTIGTNGQPTGNFVESGW